MTATTTSAYPKPVEELIPAARALADKLGEVPSRNRLMRELRVGSPKATALREVLTIIDASPVAPAAPVPVDVPPVPPADPVPVDAAAGSNSKQEPAVPVELPEPLAPVGVDGHPVSKVTTEAVPAVRKPMRSWVLLLLAAPAFVAIWSGWVGLGGLTGFGVVHPLPGIWDSLSLNTAITLPIGVEAYAAYALRAWLSGDGVPRRARRFAAWSAIGSLLLGAAGQVAYHLMESAGITSAPWQITTLVACLPVVVLGMGAALAHLLHTDES
ncbi:ABC transporter permease [Micromonospora sp. NBC_01796]|uniref:ABC transporter permease n=1 Tax=Micromonospora sp. NBC_01796 TaxID=2975987 RepID=UPI002DD9E361|nr:ABC transporter permease [Micromonospora sp. NBC_01796]WSA88369.1 ABC transporter permease [Micromonospora sp. NBC_01796]